MMNILYILQEDTGSNKLKKIGGIIAHAVGVIEAFRKLGHNVNIVTFNKLPYIEGGNVNYSLIPRISLSLPGVRGLLQQYKIYSNIVNNIQNIKPDLLYFRWPSNIFLSRIKKKYPDIPVILECNTVRGMNRRPKGRFTEFIERIEEKQNIKTADIISAVSDDVRNFLLNKYPGLDPSLVIVNPNGVNTEKFKPCNSNIRKFYNIPDDATVIGFSGYFAEWHRIDILIEAIQHIEYNVRLLLIGTGNKSIENMLRSLASEKNKERIIFTGPVEYDRMPQYLSACDILAVPQHEKQSHRSPIKLFEYMAMEKPIIAANVGQLKLVIENNVNGLLFEPNTEGLISVLRRLIEDKLLRQRLGQKARIDAITKYSWKVNVERILSEL
jgi:glycosyltransferase involved in cell wall biosynthesis